MLNEASYIGLFVNITFPQSIASMRIIKGESDTITNMLLWFLFTNDVTILRLIFHFYKILVYLLSLLQT